MHRPIHRLHKLNARRRQPLPLLEFIWHATGHPKAVILGDVHQLRNNITELPPESMFDIALFRREQLC